jgi:hypothetical protein
MARQIILGFWLLLQGFSLAQSGCTDPQANNFDPNALTNDGSCIYPATSYSMTFINNLSDEIQENSGLIRVGNFLYTFNDSGSDAKIYELDTTGAVQRSIVLTGATNVDWEAITSNSMHVFIGDFGNNSGNRQNLCVYRFLKSDLAQDTVVAEKLPFYWSDQIHFNPQANAHNFDCEAFVAREDSLVLFSKNWLNLYTRRYVLPVYWTDTIAAMVQDSFFVDGLITDASLSPDQSRTFLLGYKNNGNNFYTSFIWNLWDYSNGQVFSGNKRRIEIGNVLNVSQTEGIALTSNQSGYVSSEKVVSFVTLAPKLFKFDFGAYFNNVTIPEILPQSMVELVPHPKEGTYEIIVKRPFKIAELKDIQGRRVAFETSGKRIVTHYRGQVILKIDGSSALLYLP